MEQTFDIAVAEMMRLRSKAYTGDQVHRRNLRARIDRTAITGKAAYEAQASKNVSREDFSVDVNHWNFKVRSLVTLFL